MDIALPRADRRREIRHPANGSVLVARWPVAPDTRDDHAQLENMGLTGFRFRSGHGFQRGDILLVYLSGARGPVVGRVVWTRRDGVIEKGPAGQVGAAWLAGCETLEELPNGGLPAMPASARDLLASVARGIGWSALFAVALVASVAAGYFLASLFGLLGG
ncbi:MAG TPA: hypothetical protein VF950_05870 [Planctomycetota bacterium]